MMKEKQAEILLAAVITARATSFIFAKWCLADLDTFNLLAVRFLLAFLLPGVLFSGSCAVSPCERSGAAL